MEKELQQWIDEARKKGYSDARIRDILKKQGYDDESLAEIFPGKSYKAILLLTAIAVLIAVTAMIAINTDRERMHAEVVSAGIPGHVFIETQVSGTIEVMLPEFSGDTIMASNKSVVRQFGISLPSQGMFIDTNTIVAPAEIVPSNQEIKLAALDSLNLLADIPERYKISATHLYAVNKDILIFWKDESTVVSKGNLIKAEHLGIGEVAVIDIANQYLKTGSITDATNKVDVFFKNGSSSEINDYRFQTELTEKQAAGQDSVPYPIPAGAVAAHDGKIIGMFVSREGNMYLIPAAVLQSLSEG